MRTGAIASVRTRLFNKWQVGVIDEGGGGRYIAGGWVLYKHSAGQSFIFKIKGSIRIAGEIYSSVHYSMQGVVISER